MASPSSQSSHPIEDESSVSTTATEDPPKSKKKKKIKISNKDHLTSAEREMYNSHAFQIRQNALQLLNHAEVSSPSTKYYKSYHNDTAAASIIQPPPPLSMNNSYNNNYTTNNNYNDNREETSYGELNVSQVVSMAFGCIAHCLTESYRAASNYYSTTAAASAASTQSNVSFNHYRYETVDGEGNAMTDSTATGHIGELSRGGNVTTNNNNNNNTVSYQGYNGYQQTMERGGANQSSGQMSTESNSSIENNRNKVVQGEYATVSLPSTYQGGK
eukprot:scaffold4918_cov46-Cyclotella_meneghiniana.AAC.7